ncbi:MAG TPA: hypothetical protein HA360_00180 [Nanoarchaeota archaeon]|nr:hypothetical protein [Candidatus Woesearchaeota archaeon]HIH15324.1 hypothetical protein [Nanoarchaeota archaeon]HIH59214.1 hypothetical protein [Nanoarchaeota archaeon]HII13471.1 hypothetical protein [Nanoarchaeota archaeon]HIJ05560.1 hypothetical protein [Nanoarchaeota archaeon]
MLENHCDVEATPIVAKNPIAFYYAKAKELELHLGYLHFLSAEAKELYGQELQNVYDILFDRVMTSKLSPFFKQEIEQWYSFNRDFLGFCDTTEMNRELEKLLGKFELL